MMAKKETISNREFEKAYKTFALRHYKAPPNMKLSKCKNCGFMTHTYTYKGIKCGRCMLEKDD